MSRRDSFARSPLATVLAAGLLAALPIGGMAGEGAADPHQHCHPSAAEKPDAGALAADGEPRYARSERQYAVPDVTLVDERERSVRLRELLSGDEPVMVNFVFTTCRAICPVMSRIFASVQRELGPAARSVKLISISIDPEQDTPARLRAYAARFGARPGWRFLTGSLRDVETVERAFDVYRGDKMNHQPLTLLRTGNGSWVRLEGFAAPADLTRELQKVAMR